jgi:hypothetical protein
MTDRQRAGNAAMNNDASDSGFYARVHQGHVENFKRKITSAERESDLQGVARSIDAAAEKKMIDDADCNVLRDAVNARRRALLA